MRSRPKQVMLIAVGLTTITIASCRQNAEYSSRAVADMKPFTVNELAENPSDHFGRVTLVGVVGIVAQQKGFVLIDSSEYKECGLAALTEAGAKKIPVRWSVTAPKVRDTMRVDGELAKGDKGLTLTAQKVDKL